MSYLTGTPFGIGSQVNNPLQQPVWGLSPYATQQVIGPHQAALLVQPIAQSLLLVAQQVQQLQQLLAQQATPGIPFSPLAGFATPSLGAGLPLQTQSPFFAGQPGQVM